MQRRRPISSSNAIALSLDLGLARARSRRRCSRPRSPRPRPSAGGRCRYQRTTSRRLLVALRQLLDVRLQLLGLGLQVVAAHELADDEAEATRRSACAWNISAGIGAVSASFTPRCFRSARICSTMRSTLAGDERLRHLELGRLDERVHHARLVARLDAELDFALEVLATSARSASTVPSADAERLGERLVDRAAGAAPRSS